MSKIPTVIIGESRTLRSTWTDTDTGDLTAVTAALSVRDPHGNVTTPSILNPSTGVYEAVVLFDVEGNWHWEWTGSTSAGVKKCRGAVCVVASHVAAATSP